MSIIAIICATRMVVGLARLEKMAFAEVIKMVRILDREAVMYSKDRKTELKKQTMSLPGSMIKSALELWCN